MIFKRDLFLSTARTAKKPTVKGSIVGILTLRSDDPSIPSPREAGGKGLFNFHSIDNRIRQAGRKHMRAKTHNFLRVANIFLHS